MTLDLSKYLFWDIDQSNLDMDKHSRWLIERVISHGRLKDWKIIKRFYGLEKIKKEVLQIRTLDKKTMNFMSLVLKTPLEQFRCYKQTQSINSHWNY